MSEKALLGNDFISTILDHLTTKTENRDIIWIKTMNSKNSFCVDMEYTTNIDNKIKKIVISIGAIDHPEIKSPSVFMTIQYNYSDINKLALNTINMSGLPLGSSINDKLCLLFDCVYIQHTNNMVSDIDKKYIMDAVKIYKAS